MGEARDGGRAFCLRRVALLATNSGYLPKASGGAAVGDDSGINVVNREIATGPPNVMSELSALERASNLRRSPPPTRIMRFGRDASVTLTEGMAAAKVPPKKRRASLVPVLERLDRLAPSREGAGSDATRRVTGAQCAPRDDWRCVPRRSGSTEDYRRPVAPRHSSGVWGVPRSFQKGPYTSLHFLRTIL